MGTGGTPGAVTVTPIFWGNFNSSYETVIQTYLNDVAHDDGLLTNVFSVDLQLGINYDVTAGSAISDADPFPANGCTPDTGGVYSDDSGYTSCLTDAQIQTELGNVISNDSLPVDLAHLYMVFLPKGVESCSTSADGAQGGSCTVNYHRGGFCGYHSSTTPASVIYADIPFPSYSSPAPYTCAGMVESLSASPDADVVISTVSHELNESITDPEGSAWWDAKGYEIADECAYIYGTLSGPTGEQYNQTINGHHYFTQEQASNENYTYAKHQPCVQDVDLPVASFKVKPGSPKAGVSASFNASKSEGGGLSYSWNFGDGGSATGETPTHTYALAGSYTVTLNLTDRVGLQVTTGSTSVNVIVKP